MAGMSCASTRANSPSAISTVSSEDQPPSSSEVRSHRRGAGPDRPDLRLDMNKIKMASNNERMPVPPGPVTYPGGRAGGGPNSCSPTQLPISRVQGDASQRSPHGFGSPQVRQQPLVGFESPPAGRLRQDEYFSPHNGDAMQRGYFSPQAMDSQNCAAQRVGDASQRSPVSRLHRADFCMGGTCDRTSLVASPKGTGGRRRISAFNVHPDALPAQYQSGVDGSPHFQASPVTSPISRRGPYSDASQRTPPDASQRQPPRQQQPLPPQQQSPVANQAGAWSPTCRPEWSRPALHQQNGGGNFSPTRMGGNNEYDFGLPPPRWPQETFAQSTGGGCVGGAGGWSPNQPSSPAGNQWSPTLVGVLPNDCKSGQCAAVAMCNAAQLSPIRRQQNVTNDGECWSPQQAPAGKQTDPATSGAIGTWLAGLIAERGTVSGEDIAETLRAAAPESYED